MIKVTVELIPFGQDCFKRKIGEMVIANDLTGNIDQGNYYAWTAPDDWSQEKAMYGELKGFNRKQSVWELIRLILEVIRLEKTPSPKDPTKKKLKARLKKHLTPLKKTTPQKQQKNTLKELVKMNKKGQLK